MHARERTFVRAVRLHYKLRGRHALPWRKTRDPYRILVSEVMLQQTQVDRVIPKYRSFLDRFPTMEALACAPLGEVLRAWQGLGYNRRARMLHMCAQKIVDEHGGVFPRTHGELVRLPGVGSYTAGAVLAFAYNVPTPIIETNIRSAYLHHFFNTDTDVSDKEILAIVERTLDPARPREWYYALMDYGADVKKTFGNPNSKSTQYMRQSAFRGSDREIRGAVLKLLSEENATRLRMHRHLPFDEDRIDAQLLRLEEEGLIQKIKKTYRLPV